MRDLKNYMLEQIVEANQVNSWSLCRLLILKETSRVGDMQKEKREC
jgi:hypothetical protein